MDMPRPTEAHRQLERLVGVWTAEERLHPSPWDPLGGTAIGRVRNALALDGFAVVQDYEQERHGRVNFRGHGIFRWDATEHCVVLHWFDSMGQPPDQFRGQFEGHVLILSSSSEKGRIRVTWDFGEPGRYRYLMQVSPDGVQWFPVMEGEYVRQQ